MQKSCEIAEIKKERFLALRNCCTARSPLKSDSSLLLSKALPSCAAKIQPFMENTRERLTNRITSHEAINRVLSKLGLTREALSTYKEYSLPNGEFIRLRISDHGLFLQNWFNENKKRRVEIENVPKLNVGYNLAITFAPTETECKERNLNYPLKIKNVTMAKTIKGNNVKPQFSVRHICYYTWNLTVEDIDRISNALVLLTKNGGYYTEPLNDASKIIEWQDTSNLPPHKNYPL